MEVIIVNKVKKIFSALAVTIVFSALASCGSTSFYSEWSEAGADIKEDNVFSVLSVDDVVKKRDNKDSFIIFAGSSSKSGARSAVEEIQAQADNLDYDGLVYFVNTKDILSSISSKKEATTKLGVKEIDSSELVVVCYKEGAVFFDTSSSDSDHYERFKVNGSLSYNALATYAFDYYKVEK